VLPPQQSSHKIGDCLKKHQSIVDAARVIKHHFPAVNDGFALIMESHELEEIIGSPVFSSHTLSHLRAGLNSSLIVGWPEIQKASSGMVVHKTTTNAKPTPQATTEFIVPSKSYNSATNPEANTLRSTDSADSNIPRIEFIHPSGARGHGDTEQTNTKSTVAKGIDPDTVNAEPKSAVNTATSNAATNTLATSYKATSTSPSAGRNPASGRQARPTLTKAYKQSLTTTTLADTQRLHTGNQLQSDLDVYFRREESRL